MTTFRRARVLVAVALVVLAVATVNGEEETMSFMSFKPGDLWLLGDAVVSNGTIQLVEQAMGSGRALLPQPVTFVRDNTNSMSSFRTCFTFSMMSADGQEFGGDGLAFIIVPTNVSYGGSGGWLGFLNSTASQEDRLHSFAVEFDTFLNVEFLDPNDNHVGVDVNSMRSLQYADAGSVESINLKSGQPITAWIEYDSLSQELEVSLSYNSQQKPQKRLLSLSIDLHTIFNRQMFIGFSAATGGHVQLHSLHSWNLSTSFPSTLTPSDLPTGARAGAPSGAYPPQTSTSTSTSATSSSNEQQKCNRRLCIGTAKFLAISTACAVVGAAGVSMLLWFMCCTQSCTKLVTACIPSNKRQQLVDEEAEMQGVGGPRKLTYKELSLATKGFSPSRVLGHGAFGTVYKGQLQLHGSKEVTVAVKRAERGSKHGKEEFMSELSIIGRLRHRNLLQLQGWCRERKELLLVYDYMPNGSLDKLLLGTNTALVLTWNIRFKVVVGVAAALAYLHSEWEQQVVHRDVKASNIMLDANFNARLGDFGLARLIDHDSSPETTITAGTVGYLAPEYLHTGKATDKTDVFSFGVVVLEVCSGRRPINNSSSNNNNSSKSDEEEAVLVDWVWKLNSQQVLIRAADPRLGNNFDKEQMLLLLHLALLCCHPDPTSRPSMKQVIQILCGANSIPPLPRFKPTPSFALRPPLTIHDIMLEEDSPA